MSGTQENQNTTETNPVSEDATGAVVKPMAQAATVAVSSDALTGKTEDNTDDLILGKFKTHEDLEKAYAELEKKLGAEPQDKPTEETPATTEETPKPEDNEDKPSPYGRAVDEALKAAGVNVSDIEAEFERDGKFSEESLKAFEDAGFPREMVETYAANVASQQQASEAITEAQITEIKDAVGGEEKFTKLQGFIQANYSPEELSAYNTAVESGDVAKAKAAVEAAAARHAAEFGTENPPLKGKGNVSQPGYANEAEWQEDMAKPEYKTSEAFREQVKAKLAASPNIMLTR